LARYVLVEFSDDSTANAFCKRISEATANGQKFRLAGLFAKPQKWCECTPSFGYQKNQVVMGGKYGWWVCSVCRRPRLGNHQPHNILPFTEERLEEGKFTTISTSIILEPSKITLAPVSTSRLQARMEAEKLEQSKE